MISVWFYKTAAIFKSIVRLQGYRGCCIFASQGFRSRSPLSSEKRGDREWNPWLAKMWLLSQQGIGRVLYIIYIQRKLTLGKLVIICHSCDTSKSILYRTSCNLCLNKHAIFLKSSPQSLLLLLKPPFEQI